MRSLVSLILVGMAFATMGCASRASRPTAPETALLIGNDPSWTPPGQMNLAIGDNEQTSTPFTVTAAAAPEPNKSSIAKHQVHAATY